MKIFSTGENKMLDIIPYTIGKNDSGTFYILENPEKNTPFGSLGYIGDRVIRSPFNTIAEARKREIDIANELEYKIKEVPFKKEYLIK